MSEISDIVPFGQFVIIDNDDSTLFLCRIIIQRTYKNVGVITYIQPGQAVEYFTSTFKANREITVVLLDIDMPEMSGWEVLEHIRLLEAEIKDRLAIIILSISNDPADKLKAFNHPLVLGYLEKPITSKSFEEIMAEMKIACLYNYS